MADLCVERATVHPSAQLGAGVRIVAQDLAIDEGARVGDGAILIGGGIHLAAGSEVGPGVEVTAVDDLELGPGSVLGPGLRAAGRSLRFGAHFWSTRRVVVGGGGSQGPDSNLLVGDHTSFFDGAYVNLSESVTIGRGCALSADSVILTHGCWQPILEGYPYRFAPVVLEDDVVVYVKSVVLPGVRVRRGTTVAAGSVVSEDTPPHSLVGGVPAQVIRTDVRRPLTQADRRAILLDLLVRYAHTLPWKGARVLAGPRPDAPEIRLEHDGREQSLRLEAGPPLRLVVDDAREGAVVIDLDSMVIVGGRGTDGGPDGLGPLAEDLRDFLRRSGIKVFTGHPFRALAPARLTKLRELGRRPGSPR